jgi:hypothetical protein
MGPWNLPTPPKTDAAGFSNTMPAPVTGRALTGTEAIVSKNLFDPERGAGLTRDAEENSRAAQRVRNMILVGTIVMGNDKYAIVQDGSNPNLSAAAPGQTQGLTPMRLRLGDNIEGYRLSEIADKRVVFTRDTSKVEVLLDYFRKVDVAQPRAIVPSPPVPPGTPAGASPPVIPNLPRRARIPIPPSQRPDS